MGNLKQRLQFLEGIRMKLNNDIIVFDLEATSGKDVLGFQTNNYIIDIGAVYIDKDTLEITDTYSSLVKPEEYITEFIEKLTGISNAMTDSERLFDVVGAEFSQWVMKNTGGNPKKAMLAAWGNYFDIPLLRKLYQKYHLPYPFMGTALDVKTVAIAWLALSGNRTDKSSVGHVSELMGIQPEGAYHRAIVDAKCEGLILQRVFRDLASGMFVDTGVKPYKYLKVQVGDLS
jgi:inhibitor of KinA sporulation pathway (predicted exonuclease)